MENLRKIGDEIKKDEKDLQISTFKDELLVFLEANSIYFDKIEKKENQIKNADSLKALKKLKMWLETHLQTVDKDHYERAEAMRQKMFQMIADQHIIVDKEFLKQIATQNRISSLKYLLYQLKEKYKLNLEDLENTLNSVKSVSGGLYGQGKSRKH